MTAAMTGLGMARQRGQRRGQPAGVDHHQGVVLAGELLDVGAGGEHLLAAVEHDRAHGRSRRVSSAAAARSSSCIWVLRAFIGGRWSRMVATLAGAVVPSPRSMLTNSPIDCPFVATNR